MLLICFKRIRPRKQFASAICNDRTACLLQYLWHVCLVIWLQTERKDLSSQFKQRDYFSLCNHPKSQNSKNQQARETLQLNKAEMGLNKNTLIVKRHPFPTPPWLLLEFPRNIISKVEKTIKKKADICIHERAIYPLRWKCPKYIFPTKTGN